MKLNLINTIPAVIEFYEAGQSTSSNPTQRRSRKVEMFSIIFCDAVLVLTRPPGHTRPGCSV